MIKASELRDIAKVTKEHEKLIDTFITQNAFAIMHSARGSTFYDARINYSTLLAISKKYNLNGYNVRIVTFEAQRDESYGLEFTMGGQQ